MISNQSSLSPVKIRKSKNEEIRTSGFLILRLIKKSVGMSYRFRALKRHFYRFDHKNLCPTVFLDTRNFKALRLLKYAIDLKNDPKI